MSTDSAQATLRDRQAQRVRDELRRQFLRLVLEYGLEGFTMQDVADAAGVSVRTVYRYFPSREAFAEDVRDQAIQSQQVMEERRGPEDWTDNPDFFATTFEYFEGVRDLIRAGRVLRESGLDPAGVRQRTEQVRAQIEASVDIHPEALAQFTGVIRLLGSTDAWLRLTEDDIGLDAREAGHAVQWAMEVVLEAAKQVEGPLRPRGRDTR